MNDKNSVFPKQEVSLLNMSNTEISHISDDRNIRMQLVLFCIYGLSPRGSAELIHFENSLCVGNKKFLWPMKR